MKRPSIILMTTAILSALTGATLEGQRMPEIMYSTDTGVQTPVWISANTAIDPSGQINEKVFSPASNRTIKSYFAETPPGECSIVEEFFESRVDPPDRSYLEGAVLHSNFVFLGHITEVAHGFHFSVPGKLFRVKPSEVLQGDAFLDFYYIFYPVAEFEAGPYRICKSDRRYPDAPRLGDELLIMVPAHRVRAANDPYLELEESSSLVVLHEQGAPDLPDYFKISEREGLNPAFRNRAELVAAVRDAVKKKKEMP